MIRVLVLSDTANWCYGQRANALQKYAPDDIEIDVVPYELRLETKAICWANYDVAFVLAPNVLPGIAVELVAAGRTLPLIMSWNSGLWRRHVNLMECMHIADLTIINSFQTWSAMRCRIPVRNYRAVNISNGVDLDTYRIVTPFENRAERCIWVASQAKREDGDDIKGFGRVLFPLRILGSQYGFEFDYWAPPTGQALTPSEMCERYNEARYVLCASYSEGTPNFVLEAMACGCIPITTPVGNMPEIIRHGQSGFIIDQDTGKFWEALMAIRAGGQAADLSNNVQVAIASWDWKERSRYFYDVFRSVARGDRVEPFTYLDRPKPLPPKLCRSENGHALRADSFP